MEEEGKLLNLLCLEKLLRAINTLTFSGSDRPRSAVKPGVFLIYDIPHSVHQAHTNAL